MGLLSPGDELYHYENESHRWVAPPGMSQDAWDAGIQAHMDAHLATMGGGGITRRRLGGNR